MSGELWLAPLRGVTIRAFRETFASTIREAGFVGAVAPFIPANPGIRVNDRLISDLMPGSSDLPLVPQVITKHPDAMRTLLHAFRERGFDRADLNAGCPFPMIRKKGRGSGLLASPDTLERMLEAGCDEMGPGRFSLKTRLGLERADELLAILPRIDRYPLARIVVHARTARQMYSGQCDLAMAARVAAASVNRVVHNGDIPLDGEGMIGRAFIRSLGARSDAAKRLADYIARSREELSGAAPVLGRMKELVAYWRDIPSWRRRWPVLKLARSVDELLAVARGVH